MNVLLRLFVFVVIQLGVGLVVVHVVIELMVIGFGLLWLGVVLGFVFGVVVLFVVVLVVVVLVVVVLVVVAGLIWLGKWLRLSLFRLLLMIIAHRHSFPSLVEID